MSDNRIDTPGAATQRSATTLPAATPTAAGTSYTTRIGGDLDTVWSAITSSHFATRYGYTTLVDDTRIATYPGKADTTAMTSSPRADEVAGTTPTWVSVWHGPQATIVWELTERPGPTTEVVVKQVGDATLLGAGDSGAADPHTRGSGTGGWQWILADIADDIEARTATSDRRRGDNHS